MVKVKEDMTGWIMSEHGVPDSRLTVIKQTDDHINRSGEHSARWLCQCSCEKGTILAVIGRDLRSGHTLSCGCYKRESTSCRLKKYNKYDLSGNYGIGWTTNTNREFYFDLEDYDKIKHCCWCENVLNRNYHALMSRDTKSGDTVCMHWLLCGKGYDHIDRNPFNNRKSNLRKAEQSDNAKNISIPKNNTSGIIGVCWKKDRAKWKAYIRLNDKQKHLGYFNGKNDAIKARLTAEQKYFGEFAPQQHLHEQYGIIYEENKTK